MEEKEKQRAILKPIEIDKHKSKKHNVDEKINSVLEFWFGKGQTTTEIADQKTVLWWSKDQRIDQEITDRFLIVSKAAASGELKSWADSPHGLLALIICTDQFPRNIYRNTSQAFAQDLLALKYAKKCVDSDAAAQLKPIERAFAYLPFEHSEDIAEQQRSVALYLALAKSAAPDEAKLFNGFSDFARKHHEIIQRFGRFPHRNQILGRHSSDEEQAFLEQPGSSF